MPSLHNKPPQPFFFNWAKRQATPTAALYDSPPVVRPWQAKPEPRGGRLLVSAHDARLAESRKRGAIRLAKAKVLELEEVLTTPDLPPEERVEALATLAEKSQAANPPAPPSRAERRAAWRQSRPHMNRQRLLARSNGPIISHAEASRLWRGTWAKANAKAAGLNLLAALEHGLDPSLSRVEADDDTISLDEVKLPR